MKRTRMDADLSPLTPHINDKSTGGNNDKSIGDSVLDTINNIDLQIQNVLKLIDGGDQTEVAKAMLMTSVQLLRSARHSMQRLLSMDSAEEQERRRSIVVINLPEAVSQQPFERAQKDNSTVHALLSQMGVEAIPSGIYRMGRYLDPSRKGAPRVLKVVFPASVFQRICLGRWKHERDKIKEHDGYQKLLLRPSLTKEQRQLEWEQRQA